MPATLRINVIAETRAYPEQMHEATDGRWEADDVNGEDVAVFAGRACYQSWSRPNPDTATTQGYLAHILDVEHMSVTRHGNVVLYIQGVSRSLTHELVRHHVGIDFSQLSQRYVDSSMMDYVVPPAMRGIEMLEYRLARKWREGVEEYEFAVAELEAQMAALNLDRTSARKRAREAARAFLPGCAETKIVVNANLHAWRNFIHQRGGIMADAEIRELAVAVAEIMVAKFPSMFQDLVISTLEDGRKTAVFS